jgi:hypothetical protein
LSAISFRCHAKSVWRYDRGDLRQNPAAQSFGGRQTSALIVVEPKPPAAKLLFQDLILFAKIVNRELLLLVHPSGHRDQHEPERVEDSLGLQNTLSRALGPNARGRLINEIGILDATGV